MSPDVIIGVDPGLSTGLVILRDGERVCARQGTADEMLDLLHEKLVHYRTIELSVLVACESYVVAGPGNKHSHQPATTRAIGAFRYEAEYMGASFIVQAPGDAKRMFPNDLLRQLRLYVRPAEVGCPDAADVNDAMRHAMLALAKTQPSLLDRMLCL